MTCNIKIYKDYEDIHIKKYIYLELIIEVGRHKIMRKKKFSKKLFSERQQHLQCNL